MAYQINNMKEKLKKIKKLVRVVRKIKNFLKKHASPVIERDAYKDLRTLCDSIGLANPIFIDGGAHNGSFILKLRDDGFYDSKIIAFEPIPEIGNSILKFNDGNVMLFIKALSDKDATIEFNVNKRAVTSSILEQDMHEIYHPGGLADLSKKITVSSVRIDTLVKNGTIPQPDIIKLDLQGYELFALKGAQDVLPNVKIIFAETEFVTLYKNQPLFSEVELFLRANNFSLFNFYYLSVAANGQLLACDALFINNAFFKKEASLS